MTQEETLQRFSDQARDIEREWVFGRRTLAEVLSAALLQAAQDGERRARAECLSSAKEYVRDVVGETIAARIRATIPEEKVPQTSAIT